MVKDAEQHQEDDKRNRRAVEVRNNADALLYASEKSLREHGDKVSEEDRSRVSAAIEKLRSAKDGSDIDAIEAAMNGLTEASHKLAEAIYAEAAARKQAAGAGAAGQASSGPEFVEPGGGAQKSAGKQDTVDADFTVVDDDGKGKKC